MADLKLSALSHGTTVDPANDLIPFVDVSDTTEGPSGTTKALTPSQLAPTSIDTSQITSGTLALDRGGTGSDLSATGGAGQFVRQSTAGGALSADVIATSDLPTAGLTITSWSTPTATATDGSTVTFDLAAHSSWQVTLGGNRTLALSNAGASSRFSVVLKQDATGSRTVTWFGGILWPGGTAPTLTTTPNKRDVFTFIALSSGVYLGFTAGQSM